MRTVVVQGDLEEGALETVSAGAPHHSRRGLIASLGRRDVRHQGRRHRGNNCDQEQRVGVDPPQNPSTVPIQIASTLLSSATRAPLFRLDLGRSHHRFASLETHPDARSRAEHRSGDRLSERLAVIGIAGVAGVAGAITKQMTERGDRRYHCPLHHQGDTREGDLVHAVVCDEPAL